MWHEIVRQKDLKVTTSPMCNGYSRMEFYLKGHEGRIHTTRKAYSLSMAHRG